MDRIVIIKEPTTTVVVTAPQTVVAETAENNQVVVQGTPNQVIVSAGGPQGPPGAAGATNSLFDSFLAAENLSGHRIVIRQADGAVRYASNDLLTDINGPLWMTTEAVLTGTLVNVLFTGVFNEPSWSWTPGQPIYLGVNGVMTQTIPVNPAVFLVQIGYATSATSIYFDQYSAIRLI